MHIDELIDALRALGHEVVVIEPPARAQTGFGGKAGRLAWLRNHLPQALYELLEIAYNVPVYLRLRRAWRKHAPDALYERHNLYLLAGAWLKRRYGAPYLLEVNQPMHIERSSHGGLALGRIARETERWVWRQADVVLPVTGVLADILERAGVDSSKMSVIQNGIDPQRFAGYPSLEEAKRKLGLEGRLVLGFTGFVRAWHGLDQVVEFLARVQDPSFILLIVGDGPARGELEAQARQLGIGDQVRFTGVVRREEIRDHIASFDIALQPAATEYASPLKLFEYLALRRAVVAPRQANLLEILTDDVNALLFEMDRPGSMEATISRLAMDSSLRLRLGQRAGELITERGYTWEHNARRVVALAEGVIAGEPHGSGSAARPKPIVATSR